MTAGARYELHARGRCVGTAATRDEALPLALAAAERARAVCRVVDVTTGRVVLTARPGGRFCWT